MKKIKILLSTLSLSIVCASLMAQTSTSQAPSILNSNAEKFHGLIPNYNSLPPGVDLLQNAIKNPDDSLTIKAGRQTPDANELNRNYCESLGGIDITNESDQIIGVGTLYAVACKKGLASQYPSAKAKDKSGLYISPFDKK